MKGGFAWLGAAGLVLAVSACETDASVTDNFGVQGGEAGEAPSVGGKGGSTFAGAPSTSAGEAGAPATTPGGAPSVGSDGGEGGVGGSYDDPYGPDPTPVNVNCTEGPFFPPDKRLREELMGPGSGYLRGPLPDWVKQRETLTLSEYVQDSSGLECLTKLKYLGFDVSAGVDYSAIALMPDLAEMDIGGPGLADLSPLSGLTQLQRLRLQPDSSISNLGPLSGLSALVYLAIGPSQVSELSPLSGLSNLQTLYIVGSPVSDVAPLSALPELATLGLARTAITSATSFGGFATLARLELNENGLGTLPDLSGLQKLKHLEIQSEGLTNLSGLGGSTVEEMIVIDTPINDWSALAATSKLTSLFISGPETAPLATLSGLQAASGLTQLSLQHLDASNLSFLQHMNALIKLGIRDTAATDMSMIGTCSSLQELTIDLGGVVDLAPLSGLPQLIGLDLYSNQVASLAPLLPITTLKWLNTGNNGLDCDAELATQMALKARGVDLYTECAPYDHSRHSPPQRTK